MESVIRTDCDALVMEFADWLKSKKGIRHLPAYEPSREQARQNWKEVCAAVSAGTDATDLVLRKLLPHENTAHNRQAGNWIHIAPAITRDLRSWFENAGWVRAEDWPAIAAAVYQFVKRCTDDPAALPAACAEFGSSPHSKGLQGAFLSPILNALRPDDYLIVNTKSIEACRYLTGRKLSRRIVALPATNRTLLDLLESLRPVLTEHIATSARPCDLLDGFCHWLVAIKKVPTGSAGTKPATKDGVPSDRTSPEAAAQLLEILYPDSSARNVCLQTLAEAVELADRLGHSQWSITLSGGRIRLNVGFRRVLALSQGHVGMGLMPGVLDPATSAALESRFGPPVTSKSDPSLQYRRMPLADFMELRERLLPSFQKFMAVAARGSKRAPWSSSHSPGVLAHLEVALGRPMPTPAHSVESPRQPVTMPAAVAIKTPATVFKKVEYDVSGLLSYIANGDIGLPDIQRPFVWSTTKVRDLFDSMYRGFPVGYLLFWENSEIKGARTIGTDEKQHKIPNRLIVDGQQRLTSLYAVMRGVPVLDADFRRYRIEIAFRPRDGRFEVTDAAIRHDPEFISNITSLWVSEKSSYTIVKEFLAGLEARRTLTEQDKEAIGHNLDRLFDLRKYPFTALEITADVDEEAVADIFVRINSEGVKLNQADFILTLMSVFWDEGRTALENFSRESRVAPGHDASSSPFNHLIAPGPDQLLRAAVAVGFHRARLRSVYQVLRGKDVETGIFVPQRRDSQFSLLKEAQARVLNLNDWHLFMGGISSAGFKTGNLISSETALMYAYALYLLGRRQCGMEEHALRRLIGRWFFMSTLTGRYTAQSETTMESDLSRIRDLKGPDEFAGTLEQIIANALTSDYWTISLPDALETSSIRSPAWIAFSASQVAIQAAVLFSDKQLWEAMDPSLKPKKKAVEAHHLFPKAWLEKSGYPDRKDANQIANLAYLEWPDNIKVGASPPVEYLPELQKRFADFQWERMRWEHGLPSGWESLEYRQFLRKRRQLMAQVIRRGFDRLSGAVGEPGVHEHIWEGTEGERDLWRGIEAVELGLRRLVRAKYVAKWGQGADTRIRSCLGETSWATIEKNVQKYRAPLPLAEASRELEVLDFCYLGQMGQLMVSSEAWEMFRAAFQDKRELEDMLKQITPVRNEYAHFRSVAGQQELHCRVAIHDLTEKIAKLEA